MKILTQSLDENDNSTCCQENNNDDGVFELLEAFPFEFDKEKRFQILKALLKNKTKQR